jgi:hypothetical protein
LGSKGLGTDLRVAARGGDKDEIACQKAAASQPLAEEAAYLKGFVGDLMLLDEGTGPERELVVYDLGKSKSAFRERYTEPVHIDGNRLLFWRTTKIPPTAASCPQLNEWRTGGLVVVVEVEATLDLGTFKVSLGTSRRCMAHQS